MTTQTAKRACHGTSKNGSPCRNTAILEDGYCVAHTPNLADSRRLKPGKQPGAGRPRKPRAIDVLKERLEDEIDETLAVLFDARHATRSVVVGNGPTAHVEVVEDNQTRMAAIREIFDRAYGKSKQFSEVTHYTRDAFMEAVAELEAEHAELDRELAAGSSGND